MPLPNAENSKGKNAADLKTNKGKVHIRLTFLNEETVAVG
jgi:hypothetical protein